MEVETKVCPRCGVPVPVTNIAMHDHYHASLARRDWVLEVSR